MVQKSELLKKARSRERSPQTSGVRIPSRLSEPAEDLAGTNAAYPPLQVCEYGHMGRQPCKMCGII